MIPIGKTLIKYTKIIIIGVVMLAIIMPNLNHSLFGIYNTLGVKNANIKNIAIKLVVLKIVN